MKPFEGIRSEVKGRIPYYMDDWKVGLSSPRVLSSIILLYFINIIPAITFGVFMQKTTQNSYGVIEVLASTSMCGIIYSIVSGQPLVIVGVTGPVSIFSTTLYAICQSLQIPFLEFMFWVAIWASLMHLTLAAFNLCSLVSYITRFTCEIFGGLIGLIFTYEGITYIVKPFAGDVNLASWSLIFALGTVMLSTRLAKAKLWTLFTKQICAVLADYAMAITVVVITGLSEIPALSQSNITRLDVPSSFQTTSGRPWIIGPASVSVGIAFAAILPAFVLTILIFFDHNVSSLISHRQCTNLTKPSAYNYDFVVVGLLMIVTGILGLPATHGLIPQAPIHVISLTKMKTVTVRANGVTSTYTRAEKVIETRVSSFVISLLIGVTALSPPLLRLIGQIPESVLAGIFIYMGIETLSNNQFTSRCYMFIFRHAYRSLHFKHFNKMSQGVLARYTSLQLFCVAVIFGITFTTAAIAFPALIALLVPLRMFVVARMFTAEQLEYLDGDENEVNDGDGMEEIVPIDEVIAVVE
jgi:boron transporter